MKKRSNQKFLYFLAIICTLVSIIYQNLVSYSQKENNPIINPKITSDLEVYYLDVGQADSVLITNNGHNMLIDAGNNEDGPKLVNYIKSLGISEFDYVIGTHPHEDHIGGLDDIINNFEIKTIYMPDVITTTATFEDVLSSIENKNLNITIPQINEEFNLGEATNKIIYTGTDNNDLNNASIILKLTFCKKSFLFTGDATSTIEKEILDKDIKANVLKVGHHGSSSSSSTKFLNKVSPEYAIISVGKNNNYNHPNEETLQRIKKYTNNIKRTDELGTILIKSDGNNIEITNFATDTNGG